MGPVARTGRFVYGHNELMVQGSIRHHRVRIDGGDELASRDGCIVLPCGLPVGSDRCFVTRSSSAHAHRGLRALDFRHLPGFGLQAAWNRMVI